MLLPLARSDVRSWRASDLDSLVLHANNRNVWINLRDRFPHPYTKSDGRAFIRGAGSGLLSKVAHYRAARKMQPETFFAIAVDDVAVGGIGFVLQGDVERVSAEIGYWLGEPFWGRGIITDALAAVTRYAIERHQLTRLFALPFAYDTGSCRVLEKAGYTLEARLRRSAVKDGVLVDQFQYAFIAEG